MPLKKHWRNLRAYSNCFSGSDAVDWMLRYLKTSAYFQHLTLNRQNAIAVLQIMFRDKLFEDVRAESYNPKPFADDDRLYRFSTSNPYVFERCRLASSHSIASSSNSSISISAHTTVRTSSLDLDENVNYRSAHNPSVVESTAVAEMSKTIVVAKSSGETSNGQSESGKKLFQANTTKSAPIEFTKYRRISSPKQQRPQTG